MPSSMRTLPHFLSLSRLRSMCRGLAAVALPLVLASGCTDDEQTGTLTVNYLFGPGGNCENQGVGEVRVTLQSGNTTFDEQDPCDTNEGILMDGIKAATYDVTVEGLDGVGDTIRDNLSQAPAARRIEVLGGASNSIDVELAPTPATLRFYFQVEDSMGFFQQCSSSEIKQFEATAFRGATQMASHVFDYCAASGLVPMPDPDRAIEGDLLDGVRVRPQDAQGQMLGTVVDIGIMPPGAGKALDITVTCVETDCTGTVDLGTSDTGGSGTGDPTGGAGTGG